MSYFDPNDSPDTSNNTFLYWIFWIVTFMGSHASGLGRVIAGAMPDVTVPVHDVKYLPQLHELIPALILALACGLVSFIANKIFNIVYNKLFSKKHAKNS
jgi:H+/Cl- antiporter ClcA